MKLLYGIIALAMFSGIAYAGIDKKDGMSRYTLGVDDVNQTSVQCKIKDVVLLAKTPSDCNAAGGELTK